MTLAKYLQNPLIDSTLSTIFVTKKISIVSSLDNAENCLKTLFLWTPVILTRSDLLGGSWDQMIILHVVREQRKKGWVEWCVYESTNKLTPEQT